MLGKHPTGALGDLHVAMLAELRVALGLDGGTFRSTSRSIVSGDTPWEIELHHMVVAAPAGIHRHHCRLGGGVIAPKNCWVSRSTSRNGPSGSTWPLPPFSFHANTTPLRWRLDSPDLILLTDYSNFSVTCTGKI